MTIQYKGYWKMSESKVPRQEEIVLATVQGKEVTSLPEDLYVPPNSLKIFLDTFAGPLDLLLYLIRKPVSYTHLTLPTILLV